MSPSQNHAPQLRRNNRSTATRTNTYQKASTNKIRRVIQHVEHLKDTWVTLECTSNNGALNLLSITLRFISRLIKTVGLSLQTRRTSRFSTGLIIMRISPFFDSTMNLRRALVGTNFFARNKFNTGKSNNKPAIFAVCRPANVSTISQGMTYGIKTGVNNKRSSNTTALLAVRRFTLSKIQDARGNINILSSTVDRRMTRVNKTPYTRYLNLILLTPYTTLNFNNVNRQVSKLSPFTQNFQLRVTQGARFAQTAIVSRVGFRCANNNNGVNSVLRVAFSALTRNNVLPGSRHTRARLTNRSTGRRGM